MVELFLKLKSVSDLPQFSNQNREVNYINN